MEKSFKPSLCCSIIVHIFTHVCENLSLINWLHNIHYKHRLNKTVHKHFLRYSIFKGYSVYSCWYGTILQTHRCAFAFHVVLCVVLQYCYVSYHGPKEMTEEGIKTHFIWSIAASILYVFP